ncbi:hypothetical protein HIM_08958 [Hirsutella minnesotensis 3608]|uniref:Tudor domain-containing protein n=1 Tax=Hirsutella minnesotensis 3608 TaxID=1043627 RepID=A0A0F7ZGX4_9HYPO|nr:hypothetical protein HIM_08958 [Hirsutella minnesotensis 3608]
MSSIAAIEEEKTQYQEQLEIVLGQRRDDPENSELKALEDELRSVLDLLNENIAELQPPKSVPAAEPAPAESQPEKWSKESHPAFQKAAADDKEEAPVNYQVNDTVLAKWVSGDRGFYPARITSVTGSSSAPIYSVKFKNYDTTETLRSKDIRPISNKRKADGTSSNPGATLSAVPVSAPGVVSSAGATMYPDAKKNAQGEDAPKPKSKKMKASKELEKSQNKWKEFNTKGKMGKAKKKESMFRTPEGIHGRVGFTGSGQAMRKDPERVRPQYVPGEDVD